MNNENISLDIEAEKKAFSLELPPSQILKPELDSVQSPLSIPESTVLKNAEFSLLPDSTLFGAEQTKVELPQPAMFGAEQTKVELPQPAMFGNKYESAALPEQNLFSKATSTELPPSVPIEISKTKTGKQPIAEVAKVAVDLNVKFDAEASYKQLSTRINSFQDEVGKAFGEMNKPILPNPSPRDNFEERAATDPTNLLFTNRLQQFSTLPRWA